MKLSVLDLLYTRTNQTTAHVLSSSARLAEVADQLGYTRYWIAEHHNMPTAASTVPGVIIPYLAAGTTQIRFGSGGVMLPNHSAFSVAEQFALLEAMYPGRVDLGLGRAPGTDGVTAFLLRGNSAADAADAFPEDVDLVRQLLGIGNSSEDALTVSFSERQFDLRATPVAASSPAIWLLGSSGYSAQLAAERGLPYVFANHTGLPGAAEAIRTYRGEFRPSEEYPEPRTLLPVNLVVHPDAAEAKRLARPHLLHWVGLQTGAPLAPLRTLEEADRYTLSPQEERIAASTAASWQIGTPSQVGANLRALSKKLGVDEFMLVPFAGDSELTDPAAVGNREHTLRLLAAELLAPTD